MMIKIMVVTLVMVTAVASSVLAQTPTPSPSLEQRVSDLEAYMNNSARGADGANATTPSNISGPGPGHNAWLMTSALLVLFMTLPGLALFYGGLVRQKNVLSILAQCLGIAGLVTILWWAIGYSLVFAPGCAFFGSGNFAFLRGVTSAPNTDYSHWVSQNVFAIYQLMFAIITPALIIGSVAERMKFSAVMVIVALWMFLVYFPLAHMVWGIDGLMNGVWNPNARIRAIDFAGGTVVHMSSGWSALLLCLFLGPRLRFRKEIMVPLRRCSRYFRSARRWRNAWRVSHRRAGDCDGEFQPCRDGRDPKWARQNRRAHALAGTVESDWNYYRPGGDRNLGDRVDCARNDWLAHHTGNRAPGSRHQFARRRGLYCFWLVAHQTPAFTSYGAAGAKRHQKDRFSL